MLLFLITIYYLSPYLIIMVAREHVFNGSFIVFMLMFVLGYFVVFVALTVVFILELTGKLGSDNLVSSGLAQNMPSVLGAIA